jgi:RNA polymerase sigma-54 factor
MRTCLLAQIEALATAGCTCAYASEIVGSHLDDLGEHRYRQIARALGCSTSEVETAQCFIQQHLYPYPAAALPSGSQAADQPAYMLPDVAIVAEQGKFVVEVLHSPRRVLRLNPLYRDLARQTVQLDDETREHVQHYMARTRTFLANLRQRETTLRQISEVLIERQEEFLRHGVRHLAPLTRAEIAAVLGIHESTVSRAIADKSVVLPCGKQIALSEFFVAARPVQDALRELVANETSPLSDAELARMLQAQGHRVARRTVTKYREQLRILPSTLR